MALSTKFTRPKYSPNIIDRPRLYRQLDRWQGYRAVVVQAPAGYGKSTLASRWIDMSGLDGQSTWYSLEADDDAPYRFIEYCAAALDRVSPGLLAAVQPGFQDRHSNEQRAFDQLVAALEESFLPPSAVAGQHLLLVLDDLQRIVSPEVESLILKLLEFGPSHLHLLLLARQQTSLSLARLYSHGKILVLDKEDLRFTAEEVREYIDVHGFPTTSEAEVVELTARSEGWVSSLHLAVLSLRHGGSTPDLLRAMRGDQRWLADFLATEVLNQQRPDVRRFLLETSILARFNAPLCAAVTGMDNAQAILDEIARADLFLTELDSDGGWYRYHHLFQDLLQRRLAAQPGAGAVAVLNRRAAAWFRSGGDMQAAVRYYLNAGADDEAAELVELQVRQALLHAPYRARDFLALLPTEMLANRPQLMLDRCRLAMLFDDKQMPELVQEALRTIKSLSLTDPATARYQAEWLVLRAVTLYMQSDNTAAANVANQAQANLPSLDDFHIGTLNFLQMRLHGNEGRHEEMIRAADAALAAFERAGFTVGTLALSRELARWFMYSGDSREASHRFRQLVKDWDRGQPLDMDDLALAYYLATENSYWQDHLEQARAYQQRCLELAEQLQDRQYIFLGRCLGQALGVAGDAADVEPQAFAEQLGQVTSSTVFDFIVDCRTRYLIHTGRNDAAWQLVQEIKEGDQPPSAERRRRRLITHLRVAIAQGADLAALTPVLSEALATSRKDKDRFGQLQLLALSAWQRLRLNDPASAAAALSEAAGMARKTGYVRVVLDIPELSDLLQEVEIVREPDALPSMSEDAATKLTARERQLLMLLADGLTYEQIGAEMTVSIDTVRTHIRHIYRKLSVNNRINAIATARRLGFLTDSNNSV